MAIKLDQAENGLSILLLSTWLCFPRCKGICFFHNYLTLLLVTLEVVSALASALMLFVRAFHLHILDQYWTFNVIPIFGKSISILFWIFVFRKI